ncbi:MAG: hypothetical protein LLF83_01140 [Methanobacterium sp.]|nr:hypothetical protein [Methanobacterium sp.]
MNNIIKLILIIVLLAVFFEAGLVSSYTIVTGQPPDINKLISTQIDEINSFIKLLQGSGNKTQEAIEINNKDEVAKAIQNKTQMDGVDLQSLAAHTNESTSKDQINITITVTAYKTTTTGTNVTNGSIVIKPNETYSITALAIGKTEKDGVTVDINSIIITTIRKLYSNTGNGT